MNQKKKFTSKSYRNWHFLAVKSMTEYTEQLDPSWTQKIYNGLKSYVPASGTVPSEVVPGKYEGGFQLWECTVDLLKYMEQFDYKGKNVFELGCGRGLPGIYAALHGAASVVLQDYNKDVIEKLTMPNVRLNECPQGIIEYSASAWADCEKLFTAKKYDFVLASETIYRKEQLPDFINAIKHLLAPDGICLVAAKRVYFGLSGSVFDFVEEIKGTFNHEMYHVKDPSINSKREIVILKWKQ